MTTRTRFLSHLEGIEERCLLSASPVAWEDPALALGAVATGRALRAAAVWQAVVQITNSSRTTVHCRFRWDSSSSRSD